MVAPETFFNLGSILYPILKLGQSEIIRQRRFITFFGASYDVIFDLWELIVNYLPRNRNPMHLMWTMLFLKQYNKDSTNASVCGCDEKTFRNWVWLYLRVISRLDFVSLFKIITFN